MSFEGKGRGNSDGCFSEATFLTLSILKIFISMNRK